MTKATKQGVTVYRAKRLAALPYFLMAVGPAVAVGLFLFVSFDEIQIRLGALGGAALFVAFFSIFFDCLGRGTIELDKNKQTVRIRHFMYPLHFWDIRRKRLVEIPFEQICRVSHWSNRKGPDQVRVYTDQSRFIVLESFGHMSELERVFRELASENSLAESNSYKSDQLLIHILIVISAVMILGTFVYYFGWIVPLF